ncbi:MAG TPA: KR domain-containing protein, partial [Blastocatellia bacterium]|nr:KR domain-containing protein [Blastocatellia bacterium]
SVLSGAAPALEEVERKLQAREVAVSRLATRHAFHSEMMREIEGPFREALREVKMKAPQIQYLSNVTGRWIREEEAQSEEYWVRHLCETVRFGEGVAELLSGAERVLIEVGPGQSLGSFVKLHPRCEASQGAMVVSSLRAEEEREEDQRYLIKQLGRLWLTGVEVDWEGFYEGERRRRVPLPTYPFERQRYWIDPHLTTLAGAAHQSPLKRRSDVTNWFYRPVWRTSTLPQPAVRHEDVPDRSGWLIFLDAGGVGSGLARRLGEKQLAVVTVRRAEKFIKLNEKEYVIDPGRREDYSELIRQLGASGETPRQILHLWNVSAEERPPIDRELFDAAQELGFYSLIFLTQAFDEQNPTEAIRITAVSNDLHRVTGQERLVPEKATWRGPCQVIPQEYPNIKCRQIDLTLSDLTGPQAERLLDQLAAEVCAASSNEAVAYRGHERWVQGVESITVSGRSETSGRLRAGGVYLVTGGLGTIGLTLAEYLAQTAQAKLVLIGRSPFPDRSDWDEWLATHGDEDEVGRKIRRLRAFEELGAEVLTINADVADEPRMREAIEQISGRFGEINGVIHAAGIVSPDTFRAIHKIGRDDCEPHFYPKARGLLVIEKLLRGRKLDFYLLLSSLSSLIGGLGFVAYSAANIFLDSFAQQQALSGDIPWTSVNLDFWQSGQAENRPTGLEARLAALEMTPAEGIEVFRHLFAANLGAQVVISSGDLQARIDHWTRLESPRTAQQSAHPRPVLGTAYVGPRNEVEIRLAQIWRELLGVEQVGIEDDFFELGGHSLLATQLFSRLRVEFQVEIPVRNLFEMTTIARQAELIATIQWVAQDAEPGTVIGAAESDRIEGEL